jgi:DNA helicase-2/ATP-dependent DNA helicase PcrA
MIPERDAAERAPRDSRETHPLIGEELALLARVRAALAALPPTSQRRERALGEELVKLRDQLLSPATPKTDLPALSDQWHRGNAILQQLESHAGAPIDPASPYFAHLRLDEDGRRIDLCLGRSTCIRDGVRIVDWRNAPVSRVFYRYEQGDEFEETIAGRLRSGVVALRRALTISDAVLERVEAPEGVFERDGDAYRRVQACEPRLAGGEASALRAGAEAPALPLLGTGRGGRHGSADRRLAEITALIDPAQFDLISRPQGFVAIRGAAGSGKTTVALHRIAFLAFADPELDSSDTLFLTFSPALCRYVSHVLPALGIERVAVRTYREWAAELRRRHFSDLPADVREDTPAAVQRLKLHPLIAKALAQQVAAHPGRRAAAQAYDDFASVFVRRDLLEALAAREAPGEFSAAQLDEVVAWQRRRNDEMALHLAGEPDSGAALDAEDDTLLLRAWQLRVGPLLGPRLRPLRLRHVAIDEVQEFSPNEVELLIASCDERRSLTLAGDSQQQLLPTSSFGSWSRFLGGLGLPGAALETLRVNYRCSREIAEYASGLLGPLREDAELPESPRSGPPVEFFRFEERGAAIAFLARALRMLIGNEPRATVAILTPSRELSLLYAEALAAADVPQLRHVRDQDFGFAPGIDVTEIEQARGLEFDYVVVVEASARNFPERDEARRRLHVAATRAIHQLWISAVGTPSPLLPGARRP